jgi:hypothetical protein
MKTITISDIKIREIHFARDGDSYVMNVLYAQTDADGNEYNSKWSDPIKGNKLPNGIEAILENVFTRLSTKILKDEGITM